MCISGGLDIVKAVLCTCSMSALAFSAKTVLTVKYSETLFDSGGCWQMVSQRMIGWKMSIMSRDDFFKVADHSLQSCFFFFTACIDFLLPHVGMLHKPLNSALFLGGGTSAKAFGSFQLRVVHILAIGPEASLTFNVDL